MTALELPACRNPRPPFNTLIPIPFSLLPESSITWFAPKTTMVPFPARILELEWEQRHGIDLDDLMDLLESRRRSRS